MEYKDFQLVASDVKVVKKGKKLVTFRVQVTHTPDGRTLVKGIPVEYDANQLKQLLQGWEERPLTGPDVIQVGLWLGNVLFPAEVRELLEESINLTKAQGQRLRLRLLLENELLNVPWEYALLNRGGGEATSTDFLGLMPDVSIVRHQEAGVPAWDVKAKLPATVIVALANVGDPQLDLAKERGVIEQALQGNPHLKMITIEPAYEDLMQDKKMQAHLFHFAGHADFRPKVAEPGVVEGTGFILVDDGYGDPKPLPGDQLALRLRQAGVRVAVLGACRSGRRGDVNVWSSVAAALLKAELGAVVAMQYKIRDQSAITFAKAFYSALATGLSIDEAVTAGRIAVAATDDVGGWGVPVLYLQTWDGVIFPEQAADPTLEKEREQIRVSGHQRIKNLRGKAVAVRIRGDMTEGVAEGVQDIARLDKSAKADAVVIEGNLGGGKVRSRQNLGTVGEGASAVGVSVGSIGQPTARTRAARRATRKAQRLVCPQCHRPVEGGWEFCAYCRAPLSKT